MGKRTGKPRGAPPGNTNRLRHGLYARATIARRQAVHARCRRVRRIIALAQRMAGMEVNWFFRNARQVRGTASAVLIAHASRRTRDDARGTIAHAPLTLRGFRFIRLAVSSPPPASSGGRRRKVCV